MTDYFQGFGCSNLYRTLVFYPNTLNHCCTVHGAADSPVIVPFSGGPFPLAAYLKSVNEYRDLNQRREGSCRGCLWLAEGRYLREFHKFSDIMVHNYNRCNSNCYYCRRWEQKTVIPYNPTESLRDLQRRGLLEDKSKFNFVGGGEPALYEHLAEIADFIIEHGHLSRLATNAFVYSRDLERLLSRPGSEIVISPDCGTAESFKEIKGRDVFSQVSENIVKYSRVGDVVLKYIINPYSTTEADIEGFAALAERTRVKEVMIVPEHRAYLAGDEAYRALLPFVPRLLQALSFLNLKILQPGWFEKDLSLFEVQDNA